MDLSLSLIKDILIKNQLIRGRLRLTPTEIQKLYRSKLKQNQRIQIELSKKKEIVTSSLNQIKNLKSELKYCEETLQKAFQPSTENISLIYKNISIMSKLKNWTQSCNHKNSCCNHCSCVN